MMVDETGPASGHRAPPPADRALQRRLLHLRRRDHEVRERLARQGVLFEGYAAEMERVHLENAMELESIIAERGWPGRSLVGEDGAQAAWIIAQHAISRPEFQRRCLSLIRQAVETDEAPAAHAAYLADRIRFNKRRPQVYGTVFDWDERGQLSPWTLESPDSVDELRDRVGLPPLAETTARLRREAEAEGNRPPDDPEARRREIEAWARRVGWL